MSYLTNPEVQDLVESYIMPAIINSIMMTSSHEHELRKEIKIAVNQFVAAGLEDDLKEIRLEAREFHGS